MKHKRILYVSSGISPFIESPDISDADLRLPKLMQDNQSEVRVFMPRYGIINERRHQLHEVIRLSGMNLSICEVDQPLIIKVASVPKDRLQIYFIDNNDYFKNKGLSNPETKKPYNDNDERSMFFVKGVLETVKKLNWSPDIIHINGYISYLLPLYVRTVYKNDPAFADTKIVMNIANDEFEGCICGNFHEKLAMDGIKEDALNSFTFRNLAETAVSYSDGLVVYNDKDQGYLLKTAKVKKLPRIVRANGEPESELFINFYKQLLY